MSTYYSADGKTCYTPSLELLLPIYRSYLEEALLITRALAALPDTTIVIYPAGSHSLN